jgi:hypothetical protein
MSSLFENIVFVLHDNKFNNLFRSCLKALLLLMCYIFISDNCSAGCDEHVAICQQNMLTFLRCMQFVFRMWYGSSGIWGQEEDMPKAC